MEGNLELLVNRLKAGNRAAAAELVDIYYQQIYLFFRRLGCPRQVSEDLTQESFLQAWYHIGQLKDDYSLNGWLYRIAGNVVKLHWRRQDKDNVAVVENIESLDKIGNDSDKITENQQLEMLRVAVEKLPVKLKETVVLHYMQQLTIPQAAQAAGIREGAFKSRLNRALKILRKEQMLD